MLVQALTDYFQTHFTQHPQHDAVLWFDPEGEYTALLDHLSGITLWRYQGSLLQIRYRLIQRAPGERVVVYLPLAQNDAEILRPFFATSLLFRERLYRFLRRQGLDFPDDPEVAHELRALLPSLVARSIGKDRAFWEHNLANMERARETLLGNFGDTLLRFLAQPQASMAGLKQEQLDGLFFAQLESAYGFSATSEEPPDEIARRLAAQLILTCAYNQAEIFLQEHGAEPPPFPYPERLADPLYRGRYWGLLTRWLYNVQHEASYARWANELQDHYDLTRWVLSIPDNVRLGLQDTFANVHQALWAQVEETLAALESEEEWLNWTSIHISQLCVRAQSFWSRHLDDPCWELLFLTDGLLGAADGLRKRLDLWSRPADALLDYAWAGYKLDQEFRLLRELLNTSPRPYDQIRHRCAHAYSDVLRRMNDRFCTLLEAEGSWPPQHLEPTQGEGLPPQHGFWAEAVAVTKAGTRVAVFYVDALRYELGHELWEWLDNEQSGERRELGARLAAIPTVTPIGMAALLPDGDQCQISYDKDWEIAIQDSGNLKDKAARKQWLQRHLPDVQFYNLDKLLNTPTDRIAEASLYVIFDTTLDAVGETASTIAWNAFSTLLQSVRKGVHKVLGLGVNEVHIVTDHGFLLLDEVGEHEKVRVRDPAALAKKSRYVVGRHLGRTDQLRFPVPGSEDLEAWFPRGIGCFRTPGPYNYVHGGLSLQELVVPHIRIVRRVAGRPIRVRAELPQEIRNGQFQVRLVPVSTELFAQPRQVRLSLEKAGEAVVPALSYVVKPSGPTVVDIFLPMGCGLEPGDRVRWVLRDAVTDEVLAEQEAVSRVDLAR